MCLEIIKTISAEKVFIKVQCTRKVQLVIKSKSNLFLLHRLKGGLISSLLAGDKRFGDISGPLDLTGCDQHLKQEG